MCRLLFLKKKFNIQINLFKNIKKVTYLLKIPKHNIAHSSFELFSNFTNLFRTRGENLLLFKEF